MSLEVNLAALRTGAKVLCVGCKRELGVVVLRCVDDSVFSDPTPEDGFCPDCRRLGPLEAKLGAILSLLEELIAAVRGYPR